MEGDSASKSTAALVSKSPDDEQRASDPPPLQFYILIVIAIVLSVCCVAAIWALTSRRTKEPAADAAPPQVRQMIDTCLIPELLDRPIMCVTNYNFQVDDYGYNTIPRHLCKHIVLCCLNSTAPSDVSLAIQQGQALRNVVHRTPTYIAYGGRYLEYTNVNTMLGSDDHIAHAVDTVANVTIGGAYLGGAAVIIPDVSKIENRNHKRYEKFVLDLRAKLVSLGSYVLVVELPRSSWDVLTIYNASTLAMDRIIPVMPSHLSNQDKRVLSYATCISPRYAAGTTHGYSVSVEGAYKDLSERYSGAWPLLRKKIVFTFSVAWLHFWQRDVENRSAGIPATYKHTIPYPTVCTFKFG